MTNRKYNPDEANRIRQSIEALGDPPPKDMTRNEMLQHLLPALKAKHDIGWSVSDLTTELSKLGFDIAASTLRRHIVGEAKKNGTRRRKKLPTSGDQSAVIATAKPSAHKATGSAPKSPFNDDPYRHGGFNEDV